MWSGSLRSACWVFTVPGRERHEHVQEGFQGGVRLSAVDLARRAAAHFQAPRRRPAPPDLHSRHHASALVPKKLRPIQFLLNSRK